MAKGTKKQSGPTKAKTVMKLLPIRYRITLSYMGHERIQRNGTTYRCQYTVEPGATPGSKPFDPHDPTHIPNLTAPAPLTAAAMANIKPPAEALKQAIARLLLIAEFDKAATPSAKGGDATNPPPGNERIYSLIIVDNHGMRSADEQNSQKFGLLGRKGAPDGDTECKPANFKSTAGGKIDWMPDIQPAAPFRIVIRKFIGGAEVDLDKDLKCILEVKDPVEEFEPDDPTVPDNNPAKNLRRQFLVDFFKKFNNKSGTPDAGDDNCPDKFRGLRKDGKTGVKATDVIKTMPYKSLPVVDVPPSPITPTVQFNELGAATAHGDMNVEFPVKRDVR